MDQFCRQRKIILVLSSMLVVLLPIAFAVGCTVGVNTGMSYNPNISEKENTLIKTVAHIDMSNRKNLQLVYADYDEDVAYYFDISDSPSLEMGTVVFFKDGSSGIVTATDVYGFYVDCNESVTFGFSGTSVILEDGTSLGYVSERINDNIVYCIWS